MVKFGRGLAEQRKPEWADGYVDYKKLKKTLGLMVENGHIQEFNEDMLYSPLSLATSSEVLAPGGPREQDFMRQIEEEIDKVNRFSEKLQEDLNTYVKRLGEAFCAWERCGSKAADAALIIKDVEGAEQWLEDFELYVNLNYMAFSKILKKHDKYSTCPFRMPFLMRIQCETFVADKMAHIIKTTSDMRAALEGAEVKAGAGAFDSNQKGGASFIRKTTKYWVHTKDVLRVKMFILKHRPIYKFTDGRTDADLVSSVYFDNEKLELYDGRLKKHQGAIAFRIRWYGPESNIKVVFIERKEHLEDWYGDGEASSKLRFPLPEDQVMAYLTGELTPDGVAQLLAAMNFKGDVDEAVQLAKEIQDLVLEKKLRPAIRTHYMRTAFQRTGDATVRCSLDTELCMAVEACGADEWKRSGPLTSRTQVTQFPHAVLEVKLQLASGTEQPEWVTELLKSGYLREMPKFSKFVHGTAFLHRHSGRVKELPYWWAKEMMPLWAGASLNTHPLPVKLLKQADGLKLNKVDSVDDDDFRNEKSGWQDGSEDADSPLSTNKQAIGWLQEQVQELLLRIITCNDHCGVGSGPRISACEPSNGFASESFRYSDRRMSNEL